MIQINYRDTRPFYQQIKDNVRHLVVSGALKKDDKLPMPAPFLCLIQSAVH